MTTVEFENVLDGGTGTAIMRLRPDGTDRTDVKVIGTSQVPKLLVLASRLLPEKAAFPEADERIDVEGDEFNWTVKELRDDQGMLLPEQPDPPVYVLRIRNGISSFTDYEFDEAGLRDFVDRLTPVRQRMDQQPDQIGEHLDGPAGPPGQQGPQGEPGPPGPPGAGVPDVTGTAITSSDAPTELLSVPVAADNACHVRLSIAAVSFENVDVASFRADIVLLRDGITGPVTVKDVVVDEFKTDPSWSYLLVGEADRLVVEVVGPAAVTGTDSDVVGWRGRARLNCVQSP